MLDDATKDVRTPTHELTVAPDVLKSRRRINTQPPGLSAAGLRSLRGRDFVSGSPAASSAADGTVEVTTNPDVDRSTGGRGRKQWRRQWFGAEFVAIDAVLA